MGRDKTSSGHNNTHKVGLIFFAAGLALYAATMMRGVFPGESAALVAQSLDLDPFASPMYPIWRLLMDLMLALNPLRSVSLSANLLSVITGAACLALTYEVASRIPLWHIDENAGFSKRRAARLGRITGATAAVFLAVSAPFWLASTVAHHLTFELLLVLVAALLFLRYWESRDERWLNGFALLYGVGVVESVLFIVCAPLFALLTALALVLRNRLRLAVVGRLLGLALLGLLFYLVAAWRFYNTDAYVWREYEHFFQIIWYMWRDQWYLLSRSIGRLGWMMVFFTSILPFLIVLALPRKMTATHHAGLGSLLLHLVLSGLAGLLLINAPVAPWVLMGRAHLVVFPYLLWAIYAGYLVAYWYAALSGMTLKSTSHPPALMVFARRLWLPLVAVAAGYSAYLNAQETTKHDARLLNWFADDTLVALQDRTHVVSNGTLDPMLEIKALDQGNRIRALNLRAFRNPPYLRYVATWFEDARMQSLAEISLIPLLNEWVREDPAIETKLVTLTWDDLWSANQMTPVSEILFYGGTPDAGKVDWDALHARNEALWSAWITRLGAPGQDEAHARWIRQHISRSSNNYGVLMEDRAEKQRAGEAYRAALALDPENISARLNLTMLALREQWPEAEQLEKELEPLAELTDAQLQMWSLAARFGYIAHPEAYARRGMAWALSGKPRVAITEIQKAMQTSGDTPGLNMLLASMYFADNQWDESEAMFTRVLAEDPDHHAALLGMARLAARRGQLDVAQGYLNRLKEISATPNAVRHEEAVLELLAGRVDSARNMLEAIVEDQPGATDAWSLLVLIGLSTQDNELLDRALNVLGENAAMKPQSLMVIAHAQIQRRQWAEARQTLERVLRLRPQHVEAMDQLLRLDVVEMRQDSARQRVQQILAINPRHPFANYILGSLHYAADNKVLAESAYRVAINEHPTPEALNDLAWVLQERGALEEAMLHIEASLELNSQNPNAWHTQGVLWMRQGEQDEALRAFQQALDLNPDDYRVQISMAQLYVEQGEKEKARALLKKLMEQVARMPEAHRQSAMELFNELNR